MTFESRDLYRKSVERIARANHVSEEEVAKTAVEQASKANEQNADPRKSHVGYYLITPGVHLSDNSGRPRMLLRSIADRLHGVTDVIYLAGIAACTTVLIFAVSRVLGPFPKWWMALLSIAMVQTAIALVNLVVNLSVSRATPMSRRWWRSLAKSPTPIRHREGQRDLALMNPGLKGRDLRDAFATDEYNVLLVANKFQTGFDQPLLVAMYVDKRLSGVAAVQTLSRLNRVAPGKDQTFVLDFANAAEDIVEAFEPYYEATTLADVTDPNIVHETMAKLDAAGIYHDSEINGLVDDFLAHKGNNALTKWVTPARDRFRDRERHGNGPQRQARPRGAGAVPQGRRHLPAPVRLPVPDRQLRGPLAGEAVDLLAAPGPGDHQRAAQPRDRSVDSGLRLHRPARAGHDLGQAHRRVPLQPVKESGTGTVRDPEMVALDEVIAKINDLFSGDHPDSSVRNVVTHIKDRLEESETLQQQARNNSWPSSRPAPTCRASSSARLSGRWTPHNDLSTQILNNPDIFAETARRAGAHHLRRDEEDGLGGHPVAESEVSPGFDIVYTPSEYFGVVFAERALARRTAQVWRAVQESTTWGEFRTAMPAADWEEVVNRLDDDVPPDDTPFTPGDVGWGADGWYLGPWLPEEEVEWFPDDLIDKYGGEVDWANPNYDQLFLPGDAADEIADELRARGHHVEKTLTGDLTLLVVIPFRPLCVPNEQAKRAKLDAAAYRHDEY